MEKLPKRKHPRLKNFDYSENGYYHITICTYSNLPLLSQITVGRGLAPAETMLTPLGRIVEQQLLALPERYPNVMISKRIIMPTHIHVIMVLQESTAAGASPRPTISDIVCAYKSISTRLCNEQEKIAGRRLALVDATGYNCYKGWQRGRAPVLPFLMLSRTQ
ncbi:transposase [Sporobacter termitidis]|nr:transposase [Sporobacter termitidis]